MKPTQLYLDTARLGRMSSRAQQAHLDFTRMAGEEGASAFFDQFLHEGSGEWPLSHRARFPGLAGWRGIAALKEDLRNLAGSNPSLPLLMCNRLAHLMQFAARLLFHRCSNVLVTDLDWPPYRTILEAEASRAGRPLTSIAVKPLICDAKTVEDEVVEAVQRRFLDAGCDGLFLTAVSHLGFRFPTERLVRGLEKKREIRAIVIDGAQDFCHASSDLSNDYCDLYLAGCHKWLQGFHAMGLGFYGRRRSREIIETLLSHYLSRGEFGDPLLRFTSQLEMANLDGETETVNLVPLFTCQGAASDALDQVSRPAVFGFRRHNLHVAANLAGSCGWEPMLPAEAFQTGILLLHAERTETRNRQGRELRNAFAENGVAVTAYDDGLVRMSMPSGEWRPEEIDQLRTALQSVA